MTQRHLAHLEGLFAFDAAAEVRRISEWIIGVLRGDLRKRGLVVAVSGGVDSAVACALGVKAVGRERVFGLLMPERESSSETSKRGVQLCRELGIEYHEEDITPILEAIGCYRWRDEAIRRVFADYGDGWQSKIVIAGGNEGRYNHFKLVVRDTGGQEHETRLRIREYLQIVAATNFKQRIRKSLEYFHADRLNYAVVGTPNRVEFDQGFFVKNGDGSADLKPIAHLYKTQVFHLAKYLELPEEIVGSRPTTDTYSLSQGQDEFFFSLPYLEMDVAILFLNLGKSPSELADALKVPVERARLIYSDITQKRRTTAPLHWPGLSVEPVTGPDPTPVTVHGSEKG